MLVVSGGRNVAKRRKRVPKWDAFSSLAGGRGGKPADTTNMPIWARWWCSGRQNAARDKNVSPNGTHPCLWLEGGVGLEENHRNTKNAPCRAHFSCSVGVERVGGGGGGGEGGGGEGGVLGGK